MTDEVQKYLGKIDNYVGFKVGDNGVSDQLGELLDRFEKSGGKPGRAAAYTFQAMRLAWSALPSGVRDMALQALEDAVETALDRIGEGLESAPIVGWIADIAIYLFKVIGEARRGVDANNEAWSRQQKNTSQILTFAKAQSPTSWVYSTVKGVPYMRYRGKVGKDRWRSVPSIRPTLRSENIVFGYDKYPDPKGNCDPGKPYKSTKDGWEAKDDTSPCTYYVGFSALFYPFWSPNHNTDPITYYGAEVWPANAGFKDPGEDPNLVLMERQALLMSDPEVNLQVRGSFLRNRHDRFLKFVKYNSTGVGVDKTYQPAKDEQKYPSTKLYFDDNGLIKPYYRSAQDGQISMDVIIAEYKGVKVTAAMYNCVVGMTRAFFTARAMFLENMEFMAAYVKDGRVNSFDPEVKAAVRAASKPRRLAKAKPARTPKESGSGGGVVAIAGAAAAALLLIKR